MAVPFCRFYLPGGFPVVFPVGDPVLKTNRIYSLSLYAAHRSKHQVQGCY